MLQTLQLRQFRCFTQLDIADLPGHSVFVGDNGRGKTSILEAACLLLRLQSPRSSTRKDLIQHGAAHLVIEGRLRDNTLRFSCNATTRRLAVDDRRSVPAADYLEHSGLVVWLGNRDLELVHGSGEPRRRYLDFIACQLQPGYQRALKSYQRALRSRNYLLKKHDSIPWPQIDAYDRLLIEHGEVLLHGRSELAKLLRMPLETAHGRLAAGDGASETATADYQPSTAPGTLEAALAAARTDDARLRQTTVGPHRDDLNLRLDGRSAHRFGSEGQQRSLALAMKLAQSHLLHERSATPPLMLIDDIFGELDPGRRNAFIRNLPPDSQTMITTTYLDWLDGFPVETAVFRVADGGVSR